MPTVNAQPRSHAHARARVVLIAVATLAVLVLTLAFAQRAEAGVYRAAQCDSSVGAKSRDAKFHRTSAHYVATFGCLGRGLSIRNHSFHRTRTRSGRYGAFTLRAPKGARLIGARVRVEGHSAAGHRPRLLVIRSGRTARVWGHAAQPPHFERWRGRHSPARAISARMTCERQPSCPDSKRAYVALHRVSLLIRDSAAPSIGLGGTITAAGPRRGRQTLEAVGSDAGSGVRAISLDVNGQPVASNASTCHERAGVATRLRPCPRRATALFRLRTARAPFHQGANTLRICASDFARTSDSNRACRTEHVRVENKCPVASTDAAKLSAHFSRRGQRLEVVSGRRAMLRGRLLAEDGGPVAGAKVCVTSSERGQGQASEQSVGTPTTDSDGRFHLRVPRGPSRVIRVLHWSSNGTALVRQLLLDVHAKPRLRIRPRHTLRNHRRIRFRVHVPGPCRGRVPVAIEARSPHRWVRIAGGRTTPAGVWRGGYRFRDTTGSRRYSFRALALPARGYPYLAGHSRIHRVRVRGTGRHHGHHGHRHRAARNR